MTKAQLINALISQEDLASTISNLLEIIASSPQNPSGVDNGCIKEAEEILEELEDGDQPVYFLDTGCNSIVTPVGQVKWECTKRVGRSLIEITDECPSDAIQSPILTA